MEEKQTTLDSCKSFKSDFNLTETQSEVFRIISEHALLTDSEYLEYTDLPKNIWTARRNDLMHKGPNGLVESTSKRICAISGKMAKVWNETIKENQLNRPTHAGSRMGSLFEKKAGREFKASYKDYSKTR